LSSRNRGLPNPTRTDDNVKTAAGKNILKERKSVGAIADADQCLTEAEKVVEHDELRNDRI
jgi:hypothetical protein